VRNYVYFSAVKYADSIKFIKNPTEKVQLAAVRSHSNAIGYIKNPSDKVIKESKKQQLVEREHDLSVNDLTFTLVCYYNIRHESKLTRKLQWKNSTVSMRHL